MRIDVDPVIDLIQDGPCSSDNIHAICHITGGGLSNLLRLHDSLGGIFILLCLYYLNFNGFKKQVISIDVKCSVLSIRVVNDYCCRS